MVGGDSLESSRQDLIPKFGYMTVQVAQSGPSHQEVRSRVSLQHVVMFRRHHPLVVRTCEPDNRDMLAILILL